MPYAPPGAGPGSGPRDGPGGRRDEGSGDGPGARAGNTAGAGTDPAGVPVIVLAHGFTGSLERPALRRAAQVCARHAAVVTFSFRGHGGSGGRSTVGDREVLDLAAAVRWARSLGHPRVATLGFSMGGSVTVRHGALYRPRDAGDGDTVWPPGRPEGDVAREGRTVAYEGARALARAHTEAEEQAGADPSGPSDALAAADARRAKAPDGAGTADGDGAANSTGAADAGAVENAGAVEDAGAVDAHADAVVAVSAPARWYYRGTAPMRRLHWVIEQPVGRLVSRWGLRTRVHPEGWDPVPLSPTAAAPLLSPTPLLVVHGDQDAYFPVDHPLALARAADPEHTELWLEHGFGHAENAAEPELLNRIAAWAARRATEAG
ncbi:alpha/beta fold hydrolase [Streptomyces sp. JJ36]|nr:alpha/beta fold hydrolase [Streptomyces sp. JJ36]